MTALHTTYRPISFDQVLGQKEAVTSLQRVVKEGRTKVFLFVGPPGTGKTTLARILATAFTGGVATAVNIDEIDGATHSGAEAMREVAQRVQSRAIGASPVKVIIVDEAQRLSSAAWTCLLKPIEEPPAHVYWIFATTELGKIPKAIQTRCLRYDLKPVDELLLFDLVKDVAKKEGMNVSDDILETVAEGSVNSPRQALVNLEAVQFCESAAEARRILHSAGQSRDILTLCRFLVNNGPKTWAEAVKIVKALEGETDAESARIVITAYVTQALLNSNSDAKARPLLGILEAFSTPYNQSDKLAPLLLSIGMTLNLESG